jgi:hypothetical protein
LVDLYFWMRSDALLAMHKLGKDNDCIKAGIEHKSSYYHNPFVDLKVAERAPGKALLHNLDLCQKAWDTRYNAKSEPCSLKGVKGIGAADGSTACLVLIPNFLGTQDDADAETINPDLCPGVKLVTSPQTEKRLKPKDGALKECMAMCGLESIQMVQSRNKKLLRFKGNTSYCHGGSAAFRYDGVYAWDGDALTLVEEVFVALH